MKRIIRLMIAAFVLALATRGSIALAADEAGLAGFPGAPASPNPVACRMIEASLCADDLSGETPRRGTFCRRVGRADDVAVAYGAETLGITGNFRDAAFAARYGTTAIVAFRGTLTEWHQVDPITAAWDQANNLRSSLQPLEGLTDEEMLHNGYSRAFLNTWEPIRHALTVWRADGKLHAIYVTGHSKGGAEADIAAAVLRKDGFPLTAVYTFAAPRPGNGAFADLYDRLMNPSGGTPVPTYRYENEGDLIPHLPPTALEVRMLPPLERLLFLKAQREDYQPVGSLIYILASGKVYRPPTPSAEARLARARAQEFVGRIGAFGNSDSGEVDIMKDAHAIDIATTADAAKTRYYRTVCGMQPMEVAGTYVGD